jgi:predicted GIY-YIG superfamily endonuclease
VYYEVFEDVLEAIAREKAIKGGLAKAKDGIGGRLQQHLA